MRGRDGRPGFATPLGPWEKGALEAEQLFGSSWQSGRGAGVHAGGVATRGKGSAGVPSVGCWVQHQISRGHDEAEPEDTQVSLCQPASGGHRGALASSAQEPRGRGGSLLPTGSARHILMRPGVWSGVGSLHCPGRYVNEGRGVLLEI